MARYAPPRKRFSTIRSGSSGCATRRSTSTNLASMATPATRSTMVSGALQLLVSASDSPYTRATSPATTRTVPGQSMCTSGSRG